MPDADIVPCFQAEAQTTGGKIRFEQGCFTGAARPVDDQRLAGHEK